MGKVVQTYEFDFKFNDKNASKQLKAISKDMAAFIANMGEAADKVSVFKDLVTYLSNVDKAMSAFKSKNKDIFNDMFGNIDSMLAKEMANVFGVLEEQANTFANLKQRITSAVDSKSDLATLRKIATDINRLYATMGQADPIDINALFVGNGSKEKGTSFEQRIDVLNNALDDFALNFQGVQDKIKGGLFSGGAPERQFAKATSQYDKLKKKVEEYYDVLEQRKTVQPGTVKYDGLSAQLDEIVDAIVKIKSVDKDAEYALNDIFGDIEYGEIKNTEEALERVCEVLKIDIPSAAGGSGGGGPLGNIVTDAEYILALAGQIKNMFATLSRRSQLEYNVSINGLDIKALTGADGFVGESTQVASYLDNLFGEFTSFGHTHKGGSASINIQDILTYLDEYEKGLHKLSFIVGGDGIQTLNLDGVKKEDVSKIKELVAALNPEHKTAPLDYGKMKEFQSIIAKFGGEKNALQMWKPEQFDELARYIHQISINAMSALTPLEKMKALLDFTFGKGKIDYSKYEDILSGLNESNARDVYNQITSSEGLPTLDESNPLTMGQISKAIDENIAKFKALREEANLTYDNIKNEVSRVMEHLKSGGTTGKNLDFFKKYFPEGEWQQVKGMLTDAYDGLISIEEVQNKIATEFGIDPETFDKIPTGQSAAQIVNPIEQAKTALKEFLDLTNTIKGNDFYSYDAQGNVEIGKYIERLTAAKKVLDDLGDQGLLTAEQLSEVTLAFDQSKAKLEGSMVYYDGYGSGYSDYVDTYEDEYYQAQAENERLRAENEKLLQDKQNKTSEHLNQLKELEEGYDPDYTYYDTESLENILQERNALIQSLKSEGAITDELLAKHEALNAEIQREIDISHAYNNAEVILNKMDDMYDTVDMDDMDEVSRMLESRKQMLDSISSLAFEDEAYGDSLAKQVEQEKEQNALLEQRISLLGQVRQGLISIDDVDDILKESGSLNDKLERLGDFIYTNGLGDKIDKDDDDDITDRLEAFEAVYDRIILKLANGRNIEILPDMKGLNALVKLEKSDDGAYGPTDIDDVIFVRKQEQAVIQQNNQELQEQLGLQKQINDEVVDHDGATDINETAQIQSEVDAHNANADAIKVEANAIEQRNEALKEGNALKAQEDTIDHSGVVDTGLTTGTSTGKEDIAAEIQQLERLKAVLLEVEQAVQAKTQAFRDEGLAVEQTVSREIEALRELVLALSYIKSAIDTINDSFTSRSVRHALPTDSDVDSENVLVPTEVQNSYALETTLQTTNGYLKSILDTLSGNEAIDGLVEPLKNAVAELHNVANGIVEHQKRQQTDKIAASARIANNYGHLSSIANNAVTNIGDGSDNSVKIKGMKALADNVVRVEGAIRDTSGSWNGFIVDINEANQATITATNTQSAFAKELNETAEAAKKAAKSVQDAAKSQASSDIDALLAAGMQSRVDRANALSKAGQKVRRSALIIDGDQAFDNVLGGALVRDAYDTQALGQQMLSAGFTDADQFFDAMSQLAKNAVWTEQNIKSTWMHFASDKNLTFPNDGINKKLYASFDNVGILTVDWFNNFLTELTNRGYKGQIKIPHDITSFYDTDQIVGHAADDESWKILYDVLKTFAAKGDLRNIQAGIDATNPVIFGSKGAQGASFSELLEEIYKVAPGEVFDVEEITSIIRSAVESTTGALNEKLFKPIVDNVVNNRQSTQDEASRIADKVSKEVAKSAQDRTLQKITGQVNLEKGSLGFDFNARSLTDEQNEIVTAYDSLIAEMDKYEIAVKNGQQAELTGIEQTKQALFDKIDAYKAAHNIVNAGKTGNKKAPGATVVKNATTKYNALKNAANTEELQGSMVAQQKLDQYTAAYEKLINLQKQYKVGEVLSPDQEQEFNDARVACNNYAKEVEKMLKLHQKARDEGDQSKRYEFEGDFQDTDVGRQQAFKEFLDQYDSSSVTFEKFDDNFNKMIYTVNNGDGTFTKMTATINSTRTAIDAFAGETKEAKGALREFLDQFKGKLKSVGAYMMATVSIHDIIRVVKQGVQYVKEIDLALTELKKVTDETEQSYDNFLNTASQTASKIGSTVADFTNATADFARLGYSIEQAAELAKAASVYKNVGDGINDIATASESIISTMKAFGIEADSAMGIVDRFNEVGKYIAQAA